MYFSTLRLTQFRNYDSLDLAFGEGINCLTGNNGAGKTNILEALHYLSMTRGFQSNSEKYSMKEGESYFIVEGQVHSAGKSRKVQCSFMPPKGKKMLVDGKQIPRMSEHIGQLPLLAVLPNDTQLVYGNPVDRRKFLDSFISQYDAQYLNHLITYQRVLDQRNALLSIFAERGGFDAGQLELWDRKLIPAGRFIHKGRLDFLEKYRPIFTRYFHLIVSEKEDPVITLESGIKENTEEEWVAIFRENRKRDLQALRTTAGIHREDLSFCINGQSVKNYGSQGQQKTFVIALRLAQYELLAEASKIAPVLLLDDIFDKLDIHRLDSIAEILVNRVRGQVMITDTTLERIQKVFGAYRDRSVRYYQVNRGQVKMLEEV